MKYKAGKLPSGKYAVLCGGKHFVDSVTDLETTAEIHAFQMSMRWHQRQIDLIFEEGQKKGVFHEEDNIGDILA